MTQKRPFYSSSLYAEQRIGPHNKDVISVLVGNLLGDGYGERRGESSRFHIHMSSKRMEYVSWLHNFFAERGYCSAQKPVPKRQIKVLNKVYYSVKFRLFSFRSLNFLYDLFYLDKKKSVPENIETLLTEKALAVWIMDDGGKSGEGLKISTEGFSYKDTLLLQRACRQRFFVEPTIQRHSNKSLLYFKKSDLPALFNRVEAHLLPCMRYKFSVDKTQS